MAVRLTHVAGQPAESDYVRTGLIRIAKQHRRLLGAGGVAHELDLVRLLELHRLWIDLALGLGADRAWQQHQRKYADRQRARESGHVVTSSARNYTASGGDRGGPWLSA